jgi:hypothetical protein
MMMKKGEIPIPHIVALLLAVVVIALVGYWLFITYGPANPEGHKAACRSAAVTYCSSWNQVGFAIDSDAPTVGWYGDYNSNCQDVQSTYLGFSDNANRVAITDKGACENLLAGPA